MTQTPIIEIPVSDQPDTGIKRKVSLQHLIITQDVVAFKAVLMHYVNEGGNYGAHIPRFDTLIEKDTRGSYIDINTGAYTAPVDRNAIPLEFPAGTNPVEEIVLLRTTDIWTGIGQMLTDTVQRIDERGGLEY